jgi:hypothetical protein
MEVPVLPEITPIIAAYVRPRWEHASTSQHAKITIGARVRIAVGKWRMNLTSTKRLCLLVAELGQDVDETPSAGPGLIEQLESRLASTNDAQVREQLQRCLSEP